MFLLRPFLLKKCLLTYALSQYHGLDAIISASMVEDQVRVFNELTYEIDVLISNI